MSFHLKNLPYRTEKPREFGFTLALDKGFSTREAENFCETSSSHTDYVKLGWGTSCVSANVEAKIEIYQRAGLHVFLGGTLFEAFLIRNQLDSYVDLVKRWTLSHVEVSNGTIMLSDANKQAIIKELSKEFTVFSEVGSKDPNEILPPYKWVKIIEGELAAGSSRVICEARESGTVGVFRPNGEVRSGLIEEITDQIPKEKLIFEAPQKEQQVWFIKKFGSNVNLGNINPEDVISLETLRMGLRSDTLMDFYSVAPDNFMGDALTNTKQENEKGKL